MSDPTLTPLPKDVLVERKVIAGTGVVSVTLGPFALSTEHGLRCFTVQLDARQPSEQRAVHALWSASSMTPANFRKKDEFHRYKTRIQTATDTEIMAHLQLGMASDRVLAPVYELARHACLLTHATFVGGKVNFLGMGPAAYASLIVQQLNRIDWDLHGIGLLAREVLKDTGGKRLKVEEVRDAIIQASPRLLALNERVWSGYEDVAAGVMPRTFERNYTHDAPDIWPAPGVEFIS